MNRWIVCLKHGQKYDSIYVNKLYNMCKRNSKISFGFACITEDASGLNPEIKHIAIPNHLSLNGWWYKPWVFSNELPLEGTILFLDLDIVIIQNIDELWSYHPDSFCIIRDFNRSVQKDWNKFNSSIFKLTKGSHSYVWTNFIKDTSIMRKMHGDQDWIFSQITKNFQFWPDQWMQSYKWEIRDRQEIIRVDNKRVFKNIRSPIINQETKILVFHGDPKPSDVQDPIVVANWV